MNLGTVFPMETSVVAPLLPVSLEESQVVLHEQTSRRAAGETILKRQEVAARQEERNRRLE
jgi:hypothetical protein